MSSGDGRSGSSSPSSLSSSSSRFAALAVSPRAAVLLAAVVVVIALVVVLLGARSGSSAPDDGGGALTVTGAPSVRSSTAATGGPGSPGVRGSSPSASAVADRVVVHVLGAVARPGLVTLTAGSRVSDAVDRAGGARDDADLSRVNLARVLADGERLYVPATGETAIPEPVDGPPGAGADVGAGATGASSGTVVDLNSADQTALETLPGIGPSLAGRILAWRDEHGRFAAVEDLLDVSGIGDARFAELRDRVRV
ncbi:MULTISPECIES: helix-hairpin-helix domain-containing protein [unclassified Curtobacterium]|uniref:helix-hairpin-helix domain-containing protein n=1 Tax=unclassified Curtobacterium TaxID=257496 RepID=UPI003A813072